MRLAYKAFYPGFVCRGYKFHPTEKNVTKEANCVKNGFHCCDNPLDCLYHYPDIKKSIYCIVDIGGDMDEDAVDSKIAATELTIKKVLDLPTFFLHILIYMAKHPKAPSNPRIQREAGTAQNGYVVVRGKNPIAKGKNNDILAFAEEDEAGNIAEIAVIVVDGDKIKEDTYYNIQAKEESHREL